MKRGSAGGIATGIKLRKEALERYYKNPNICQFCKQVIEIGLEQKVSEIRSKKFCNHSCSAKYQNELKPRKEKKERIQKEKKITNWLDTLTDKKKGLFKKERVMYHRYRASVRKHAHMIYFRNHSNKICEKCGYDKYIEVCHKKAVKDFEDTCTLGEINHIDNLIGLCPNCHWEMDNMRGD